MHSFGGRQTEKVDCKTSVYNHLLIENKNRIEDFQLVCRRELDMIIFSAAFEFFGSLLSNERACLDCSGGVKRPF